MEVEVRRVDWELVKTFKISYRSRTHAETVVLELRDSGLIGRGEALGVSYRGESADLIAKQLRDVAQCLAGGISRQELQSLLPAGGARNAADCALWDLESKRSQNRAWSLAGMGQIRSLTTDYTLSADTPDEMRRAAMDCTQYSVLKLKLCGEGDVERVAAVRAGRPDAKLIVDANQAWSEAQLLAFAPRLAQFGVLLIEQPLAVGNDGVLTRYRSPIPLCADESCQTTASLHGLQGKYQYVNIKLDKSGGLTEALQLAQAAKAMSFGLMVGCMGGSSLSMAPAFVVGQMCDFVDLDGPLWARSDVADGICYQGGEMHSPASALWG